MRLHQVVQSLIPLRVTYLARWHFHSLSGQPIPVRCQFLHRTFSLYPVGISHIATCFHSLLSFHCTLLFNHCLSESGVQQVSPPFVFHLRGFPLIFLDSLLCWCSQVGHRSPDVGVSAEERGHMLVTAALHVLSLQHCRSALPSSALLTIYWVSGS